MEHLLFHAARDETAVAYSLTVFLCGHDYGCRIIVSCIPYRVHVCTGELMMVGEVEMLDYLVVTAEVVSERSVIGDAREQDESLGIKIPWVSLWENCLGCIVCD